MRVVPSPPDIETSADGADAAPLRLRPPRHQVDRRAVGLWTVHAVLTAVLVVVVLAMAAALIEPARPWLTAATGLAVVGGLAYVVAMPRIRYRVHRWEVTDAAVYT
ncbi:MAG: PH domain-containing protein, partial [Acidimicrobiales bacterium]